MKILRKQRAVCLAGIASFLCTCWEWQFLTAQFMLERCIWEHYRPGDLWSPAHWQCCVNTSHAWWTMCFSQLSLTHVKSPSTLLVWYHWKTWHHSLRVAFSQQIRMLSLGLSKCLNWAGCHFKWFASMVVASLKSITQSHVLNTLKHHRDGKTGSKWCFCMLLKGRAIWLRHKAAHLHPLEQTLSIFDSAAISVTNHLSHLKPLDTAVSKNGKKPYACPEQSRVILDLPDQGRPCAYSLYAVSMFPRHRRMNMQWFTWWTHKYKMQKNVKYFLISQFNLEAEPNTPPFDLIVSNIGTALIRN